MLYKRVEYKNGIKEKMLGSINTKGFNSINLKKKRDFQHVNYRIPILNIISMNILRIAQKRLVTNVTLDKDTIKQREKVVGDARFEPATA